MSEHKWAEVIKAWADGKEIQFRIYRDAWLDYRVSSVPGFNVEGVEWRIKPERWYRVAEFRNTAGGCTSTAENEVHENLWPARDSFVRWLTDRVYY